MDGTVAEADEPDERFTVELSVAALGGPHGDGLAGGRRRPQHHRHRRADRHEPLGRRLRQRRHRARPAGRRAERASPDEPAPPPPPATGTLTGAGNDTVGKVDQLGFTTYVQAFADLITSPHTQPPLTIGIFGSWGMGKSFLLEHIEQRDRRAASRPTRTCVPRVHVVRVQRLGVLGDRGRLARPRAQDRHPPRPARDVAVAQARAHARAVEPHSASGASCARSSSRVRSSSARRSPSRCSAARTGSRRRSPGVTTGARRRSGCSRRPRTPSPTGSRRCSPRATTAASSASWRTSSTTSRRSRSACIAPTRTATTSSPGASSSSSTTSTAASRRRPSRSCRPSTCC